MIRKFIIKAKKNRLESILISIAALGLCYLTFKQTAVHFAPDFSSFYWASKVTFDHGISPYQLQTLKHFGGQYTFPFIYPPTSLLALFPLHFFDFKSAQIFNYTLNLFALFTSIFLLSKSSFGSINKNYWMITSILFAMYMQPVILSLANGQINLLILLFIVTSWFFARAQKDIFAGLCIALATAIKVYPALFIFLFFIAGRKKAGITGILAVGIIAIVSWEILPVVVFEGWQTNVLLDYLEKQNLTSLPKTFLGNISIQGFLEKLSSIQGTYSSTRAGTWIMAANVLSLLIIIATAWIVRRSKIQNEHNTIDKIYAFGSVTLLLAAPLTWDHHLCQLVITTFWLSSNTATLNKYLRLSAVTSVLIIGWHFPNLPLPNNDNLLGIYSIKFYALVGLWITCAIISLGKSSTQMLHCQTAPSALAH